jgi:hypothetical protein
MIKRFFDVFRGLFGARNRVREEEPMAALVASAARCTGCGACDVTMTGYERLPRPTRPSFRGPSDLALTIGRSPDDVEAVRDLAGRLDDDALAVAEAACPERIPLVELARALRTKALAVPLPVAPRLPRKPHDPG